MKKLLILTVLFVAILPNVTATLPNHSDSSLSVADTINIDSSNRLKVGLVLSGGGAKGTAHIGVLKVLEQAGIPIDYIAGTSMGAIVGGLYSIGFRADDLEELFRSQQWAKLLTSTLDRNILSHEEKELSDKTIISIPFSSYMPEISNGVLSGESVLNMLTLYTTGYHNMQSFDDLPIPFACVTYDINSGDEVVIREGNLASAIRSSMSIPGVFEMVMEDDKLFIDGGVINNFPVDVVLDMGADVVIGVDVSMITEVRDTMDNFEPTFGSLSFVTQTLLDRMGKEKFLENLEDVDLYIAPRIYPYSTVSFSNQAIDSLIQRGVTAANNNLQAIMDFKKMVYNTNYIPEVQNIEEPTTKRKNISLSSDTIQINQIHITGLENIKENRIVNTLKIDKYSKTTYSDIERGINNVKGTGLFSVVSYSLNNREGEESYDLIVNCIEKANSKVHLGVRFDSEELAALYLHSTLSTRRLNGGIAEVKGRLSIDPYINVGLFYRDPLLGRTGVSYEYQKSTVEVLSPTDSDDPLPTDADFAQHTLNFHLFELYIKNFNFDMKLKYKRFVPHHSAFFQYDPAFQTQYSENLIVYSASLYYDSYDDAYFPSRGVKFSLNYDFNTDNFISYKERGGIGHAEVLLEGVIPIAKRFYATPSLYGQVIDMTSAPFTLRNLLGGHIDKYYTDSQKLFYGQRTVSVVESCIGIAYLDLRYRLGENHYIWTKVNAAHSSNRIYDRDTPATTYLGGATGYSYNSILGPITLMVDYMFAPYKNVGVFLSLGKRF